jgi:hypothetical protein
VSIQRCTIWSRTKPDADKLAAGFAEVSGLLDLNCSVIREGKPYVSSSKAWQEGIDSFSKHEFTGEGIGVVIRHRTKKVLRGDSAFDTF